MITPGTAEALLAAMTEAVYVVDRDRTITYWNHAAEALTGHAQDEVLGRRCRDGILNHVDDCGKKLCGHACPLLQTMRDGSTSRAKVWMLHRDGHRVPVEVSAAPLRDDGGRIVGAVEVFHRDDQYRTVAAELDLAQSAALTDPLTGLGNRRMFSAELRRRWSDLSRSGGNFAVLFADIDHFKVVNDVHGHDVGDETLRFVARTITACVRPSDVVARWGGEEFVIAAGVDGEAAARALAERVLTMCAAGRLANDDLHVVVTVSIGVALAHSGETSPALMRRADRAMYRAKAAGRNRVALAVGDRPRQEA